MAQEGATAVYEDNTGAIAWATDIPNFKRNKHADVTVRFVHELVDRDEIDVVHVPTAAQCAVTLTKPHFGPAFIAGRDGLSVRVRTSLFN